MILCINLLPSECSKHAFVLEMPVRAGGRSLQAKTRRYGTGGGATQEAVNATDHSGAVHGLDGSILMTTD